MTYNCSVKVLLFLLFFVKSALSDFCGKIFTEKHFILKSENYPGSYPEYTNCYYLIKGESCTEFFEFEFIDFDLKKSTGCTEERLEIGSQDALCGSKNGTKIYKAENGELKLKFVSSKVKDREFFNKGFKIYIKRIECPSNSIGQEETTGFNIEDATNEVSYEWTTSVIPTTISTPTYFNFNTNIKQCCSQNVFKSKRFIIVSPNYPFSVNTPEECGYVIMKANQDICRLRIHLKFFYLGQNTYTSCPYGYLEIDGKFICGCNSNVNLISNFGFSNSKVLNFKSFGIPLQNSYSGFVLEVIQDECPKKYRPDNTYLPPVQLKSFRSYEDSDNRVKWPITRRVKRTLNTNEGKQRISDTEKESVNKNNHLRSKRDDGVRFDSKLNINLWPDGAKIQKAKLLGEKSFVEAAGSNEISDNFSNVIKYVYYFAPEGENQDIDIDVGQNTNTNVDSNKEGDANYIETSRINTILANLYGYQQCCQWNQMQFYSLKSQYGDNLEGTCRVPEKDTNLETNKNCVVLNSVSGNFGSPNYPFGYPGGLNICYRFQLLPHYCEIKLLFKDFDLETSQECRKDYLKLSGSGYRYCGSYWSKTTSILNSRKNSSPELLFVSDFHNNGRGFSIFYQQIPCNGYSYNRGNQAGNSMPVVLSSRNAPERNTSLPKQSPQVNNTSRIKPFLLRTVEDSVGCDTIIQMETFMLTDKKILKNGDASGMECRIKIKKVNDDVCKLKLIFDDFYFNCNIEFLEIDEKVICGNLTGKTLVINMDVPEKIVHYKRNQTSNGQNEEKRTFTILGEQIRQDCDALAEPKVAEIPEIQRAIDTVDRSDDSQTENPIDTDNNDKINKKTRVG